MHHRESESTINPFSFPAETDGRFTMLVVSAVLIALYTVLIRVFSYPLMSNDVIWMLHVSQIMETMMNGADGFSVSDAQLRQMAEILPSLYLNALLLGLPRLILFSLFMLVLVGAAYGLYRIHPAWTQRRQQLRALTDFPSPERARALEDMVQAAAATAGVAPPTIMVRRHPLSEAAVFGIHNRYILRLNAWPLTAQIDELDELVRREQTPLRTQILHELGHIANHDVRRSRAARAIWDVFIWLVIVPLSVATTCFVAFQILQLLAIAEGEQIVSVIWGHSGFVSFVLQLVALVQVVRFSYAALLRVREFYADWRAVLWGERQQLTAMLEERARIEQEQAQQQPGRWPALIRTWKRLWGYHTSAKDRLEHINKPLRLFRVSSDLAFLTGILLAFITGGLIVLVIAVGFSLAELLEVVTWTLIRITIVYPAPLNRLLYLLIIIVMHFVIPFGAALGALLVIAYLIVGSLGRQMQRAAVADLLPASGRPWGYIGLWRIAFFLALGQELGFVILPTSALSITNLPTLLLIPGWIAIFTTLIWFWLVYVRAFSQYTLGTHSGRKLPPAKRWLVSGCTIIALWTLYFPVLGARLLIAGARFMDDQQFLAQLPAAVPFASTMSSVVLLLWLVGVVLFLLWTGLTLGVAYLWSVWRRPICPSCGLRSRELYAVGRRCANCYAQLAAWLFVPRRRIP